MLAAVFSRAGEKQAGMTGREGAMKRVLAFGLLAPYLLAPLPARADFIYATAGNGTGLVKVDPATGAGTPIGSSGTRGSFAAAFAPNGTLYGNANFNTANDRLVTYDLGTGRATAATPGTFGVSDLVALQFDRAGTLFAGSFSGGFYRVNTTTGGATLVGNTGISGLTDLALDTTGKLWATNKRDLFTIDRATGASTLVAAFTGAGAGDIGGIMFGRNNTLYATSDVAGSSLFTVDPVTGALTLVGNTGQPFLLGGDFQLPTTTPEPGGLALAGLGTALGAVGLLAYCRLKRAAAG
jgi:hypothetical protein